ncbi:hypothetical protein VTL71DRAFT_9567 [Oculimacula yallundae]|uniref:Uncharacterized protein n=1 Tax=Oculimacula yallundae TaxID=86028 RepID=A0ABR4BR57_9HELO
MATTTNVLITGPNRGIGNGLLAAYLLLPSHTIIAAVRDPSSQASLALQSLPKAANTTLIIVRIDSEDDSSPLAAITTLKNEHGIKKLDIVIANAGICDFFGRVEDVSASELTRHFQINTVAPLMLFNAVSPLFNLSPSSTPPKFILVSSAVGSLTLIPHMPFSCPPYGASKIAGTYLVRKMHFENEGLIAFPVHPGWVMTEMGNKGAEVAGKEGGEAEITLKESVEGLMDVIAKATREEMGGKLMNFDGSVLPW